MMPFTQHCGVALPLLRDNIDTDAIIPSREMRTVSRSGLAAGLFAPWRYLDADARTPNPEFALNQSEYNGASILLAGDNFGCGSSREHAPWALKDFGIRAVISTSFADIFYNNCFKNGILPIRVTKAQLDALMDDAGKGANAVIDIDLEAQEIQRPNGEKISFTIDEHRRHCLINGLDDIGLTMQRDPSKCITI